MPKAAEVVEELKVPRVSCKKQPGDRVPRAPREEEWVSPQTGQLSEMAAKWVARLLGIVEKDRKLRKEEHDCLDDHEKKGIITQ